VRHVSDALLRVVDGLDNRCGEFFQQVRKLVLLFGGFSSGSIGLGASSDASVWVKTTDGTVALL